MSEFNLVFLIAASVVFITIIIVGMMCAYRNGVVDGYGYSQEPNCPGYKNAGEYLKKYMAHRWPELRK